MHEPVSHRALRTIVLALAFLTLSCAHAASADDRYASGRLYGELGLGAGAVKVGELDFYPGFASAALGAFVWPGIGVEVFADGGLREGIDDGFQLEVSQGVGAGIRLESPPSDGLAGYVVLGYAEFRVRQDRDNDRGRTADLVEDFGGVRVSVGLVQRFERVRSLSLAAEYRKYYVEDGLDLDALVVSLRVSAP